MREKVYFIKITTQAELHLIEIINYLVNEIKKLVTAKRLPEKNRTIDFITLYTAITACFIFY